MGACHCAIPLRHNVDRIHVPVLLPTYLPFKNEIQVCTHYCLESKVGMVAVLPWKTFTRRSTAIKRMHIKENVSSYCVPILCCAGVDVYFVCSTKLESNKDRFLFIVLKCFKSRNFGSFVQSEPERFITPPGSLTRERPEKCLSNLETT